LPTRKRPTTSESDPAEFSMTVLGRWALAIGVATSLSESRFDEVEDNKKVALFSSSASLEQTLK